MSEGPGGLLPLWGGYLRPCEKRDEQAIESKPVDYSSLRVSAAVPVSNLIPVMASPGDEL